VTRGFLVSDTLRGKIKDTIARVDGMPEVSAPTRIETRFETLQQPAGGKTFRVCTFTGSWSINASKTVTFRGVTSTPNTVSAINLFAAVGNTASSVPKDCAIAKDGTQWYLIAAVCETAT
jgi:hypothetical protein